jgi:hypothetical protein
MAKKKITKDEAIKLAEKMGVDFKKDFHAQSYGTDLAAIAKLAGYKKSASASGSTGRCFFDHLAKYKK